MARDQFPNEPIEGEPMDDLSAKGTKRRKSGRPGNPLAGGLKQFRGRLVPSKETFGLLKWVVVGFLVLTGGFTSIRSMRCIGTISRRFWSTRSPLRKA